LGLRFRYLDLGGGAQLRGRGGHGLPAAVREEARTLVTPDSDGGGRVVAAYSSDARCHNIDVDVRPQKRANV